MSNQKALWIVWTEEAEQRLGGQASFDARMTRGEVAVETPRQNLGTRDPVVL